MIINVTQDDIDRGLPNTNNLCPVALALKRCTNKHCRAFPYILYIGDNEVKPPVEVRSFIFSFDYFGKNVGREPFSFEIPDEVVNG